MKRFGAFVLAAVMVAAALAARGALGSATRTRSASGGDAQPAGIVCASDLAEICAAAGVPLAGKPEAGDTADALIAADDARRSRRRRLARSPAHGPRWCMAERERNRDDPLFEVVGAPARLERGRCSPSGSDRAVQLAERCGQPGRRRPGLAVPRRAVRHGAARRRPRPGRRPRRRQCRRPRRGRVAGCRSARHARTSPPTTSRLDDFRSLAARARSAARLPTRCGRCASRDRGRSPPQGTVGRRRQEPLQHLRRDLRPTVPEPRGAGRRRPGRPGRHRRARATAADGARRTLLDAAGWDPPSDGPPDCRPEACSPPSVRCGRRTGDQGGAGRRRERTCAGGRPAGESRRWWSLAASPPPAAATRATCPSTRTATSRSTGTAASSSTPPSRRRRSSCSRRWPTSSTGPTSPPPRSTARRSASPSPCSPRPRAARRSCSTAAGTRPAEGPRPVIWSPASSAWQTVLNQRFAAAGPRADRQRRHAVHAHAARHRHARADGPGARLARRGRSAGATSSGLARSQQGWAEFGHPEWGAFRLGKTNPNFSTSGLSALIAQTYAAAGKRDGLSAEDLAPARGRPVRHRRRDRGRALRRHHPHVHEQLVPGRPARQPLRLHLGRSGRGEVGHRLQHRQPRRRAQQGEQPRPPRVPLVAIYPEEGTLYSDNPLIVLDAEWVDDDEKAAAARFVEFAQRPENQAPGARVRLPARQPRRRDRPHRSTGPTASTPPSPRRCSRCRRRRSPWPSSTPGPTQRKGARVTLVVDVSGSMGEPASGDGPRPSSTWPRPRPSRPSTSSRTTTRSGCASSPPTSARAARRSSTSCPLSRVGDVRERLAGEIRNLVPLNGTPLYDVTPHDLRGAGRAPTTRPASTRWWSSPTDATTTASPATTSASSTTCSPRSAPAPRGRRAARCACSRSPTAATPTSRRCGLIAEASSGAVYDASDPRSIDKVFTAVISNF